MENDRSPRTPPAPPLCHSGKDGECNWSECPQKQDYQIYCPYAAYWEAIWNKEMA